MKIDFIWFVTVMIAIIVLLWNDHFQEKQMEIMYRHVKQIEANQEAALFAIQRGK